MMLVSFASMIIIYIKLLRESAANVTLPISSQKKIFIILLYSSHQIKFVHSWLKRLSVTPAEAVSSLFYFPFNFTKQNSRMSQPYKMKILHYPQEQKILSHVTSLSYSIGCTETFVSC